MIRCALKPHHSIRITFKSWHFFVIESVKRKTDLSISCAMFNLELFISKQQFYPQINNIIFDYLESKRISKPKSYPIKINIIYKRFLSKMFRNCCRYRCVGVTRINLWYTWRSLDINCTVYFTIESIGSTRGTILYLNEHWHQSISYGYW